MENNILTALIIGPLIIPNLFVIIGSIGCVIGVKIMEMYLNYCKSHNIYIDPSAGIIYGIYGMILGFFGIFIFLIVLFVLIIVIYLLVKIIKLIYKYTR
ncbi:hypothetical protein QJ854_gp950 [Moumouvirus goulette]|uniref:Uncharacterized protein n=1 Tax=Moumouvirus goulette TaxID=1247379 RepID=M1PVS6_9VIRU|nr:hypothetical protein QJ854_gp950 [Moumouvirus goulette]AGF84832.1 hypothetical protein glt_00023 [Moumouvirus goulette]